VRLLRRGRHLEKLKAFAGQKGIKSRARTPSNRAQKSGIRRSVVVVSCMRTSAHRSQLGKAGLERPPPACRSPLRSPTWLQRRPPGHDADPPDGSHRRLARHRVALRRGRTRLGDGLRAGVSLEVGLTVRSIDRIEFPSASAPINAICFFAECVHRC
jgi:hypothetical protein